MTPVPDQSRWRPPAGVERLFACGALLLAVVAVCALTLAELNVFSRSHLLLAVIPCMACGTWWILRERAASEDDRLPVPRWQTFVLAACVLMLTVVTTRPSEYLVNGADATMYLNIAAVMEQRGGIVTSEPLLADLDAETREALFTRDPAWPHLLNLFPGGIQIADDRAEILPSFFHLWPAAIAGFSALTGSPSAGDLVTSFAGVLTLVGAWLLAVRLSSPVAATTTGVLLTLNFAHVWFSRFPLSEMMTAALIVGGVFFAVRAAQETSRVSGALGGLLFGLAASTRLDVFVLVTPFVIAYLVIIAVRGHWTSATTVLAATGAVFTTQALLHASLVAAPYTLRILWSVFGTDWFTARTTLLVPAAVAAFALLGVFVSRWGRTLTRAPIVRILLAAVLLAVIVRSWPQLWTGAGSLLLTPVGMAAIVCGAIWLACDEPSPEALLVVALFVVSAVVFVEGRTSGPYYPFIWRRFVPIVLPIGLVLAGHAMTVLWRQRAPFRWGAPILTAGLAIVFALHSQVILTATPMTGIREQFLRIAESLPQNAVLITDVSTPSHFGPSLHFSFERPVLLIRSAQPAAVRQMAERMEASGRTLVLAIASHPVDGSLHRMDFEGLDLVPSGQIVLQWNELERTRNTMPTRMVDVQAPIELYDVRVQRRASLPVMMDLGLADFSWRGDGFHGVEQMGDASVRWTAGAADVIAPRIEPVERARLVLRLAAPRPAGWRQPDVSVILDSRVIGTVRDVPPQFTTVAIELDRAAIDTLESGPAALKLRSDFFIPRESELGDDPRQLGVIVDWLRIEAEQK